ncbi:MAG: hypothetical protein QXI23_01420 [Candidatus Aenigmatarchaeota archaeon]
MAKFSQEALKLILRYGMGCIPEEKREKAKEAIFENCTEELVKELLPEACQNLEALVPNEIKENHVRKYFLDLHTKIASITEKMNCTAFKAKIIKSYGDECVVVYNNRTEKVKCLEKFDVGDVVIVHRSYVVEKYDENLHAWQSFVEKR